MIKSSVTIKSVSVSGSAKFHPPKPHAPARVAQTPASVADHSGRRRNEPPRWLVPYPACGSVFVLHVLGVWHGLRPAACGGWREQWELRLQVIVSRFIIPLSSFAPQNVIHYSPLPSLPMGKRLIWDLLLLAPAFPRLFCWSGHLSGFCIGITTSHLMIFFIRDMNWVRITRNLGSLAT